MKYVLLIGLLLMGVGLSRPAQARPTQLACVAEAIYHEARGALYIDKWAVARTIYNRTKHPKDFASTPCAVVKQRTRVKVKHHYVTVVQFPWGNHFLKRHAEEASYHKALEIAALVKRTPPKGCERNILYFGTPNALMGLPTHVCIRGRMTYRVPLARQVHHRHRTSV